MKGKLLDFGCLRLLNLIQSHNLLLFRSYPKMVGKKRVGVMVLEFNDVYKSFVEVGFDSSKSQIFFFMYHRTCTQISTVEDSDFTSLV